MHFDLKSKLLSHHFSPSLLCYYDHIANLWLNMSNYFLDLRRSIPKKISKYLIDKDNCERFLRAHTQGTFCQQEDFKVSLEI